MVNTFSFLSFPFLSIAISYMLKPMIDIFKFICYRAWITLEGNQMPLGMCHSRVFDLLYELVMIKVTACHPSKKKCKHSMKRTIPIRILLAYLMIISNPFEGTISFENSKCLHVFVSHWLTQMKNEREREREIPSMHARLLSKGEPISSSSSNGLSSTDTGLNCSFCLFVHSCYDPYHVHLINDFGYAPVFIHMLCQCEVTGRLRHFWTHYSPFTLIFEKVLRICTCLFRDFAL